MRQTRGSSLTVAGFIAALCLVVAAAPNPGFSAETPRDTSGSSASDAAAESADNPQAGTRETGDSESDASRVEAMLDRLSKAGSKAEAKAIERQIVAAWHRSGSDTIDLLAARAADSIQSKNYGVALQYLDTIVDADPGFVEGWNMRATVYFLIDEYELSLADIQQVLALQPRHFGALSGLGMIFRDLDEPGKALDAFRQVLSVHPFFGNARESIDKLKPEVEGREI